MHIPPPCPLGCGRPRHILACPVCTNRIDCAEAFARAHGRSCRWWSANPGPQTSFLSSSANEVLYGGAAGGGKSAGLVVIPTRWVHIGDYRAIGFRRETPQLKDLLDKADAVYRISWPEAKRNRTEGSWTWPEGATVRYTHLQNDGDEAAHDGQEYQTVLFDEVTHFLEKMYKALRARVRSPRTDLPRILRCTTNPGGPGAEWVFRHWGPWLNPEWAPGHTYLPTRADGTPLMARTAYGTTLPPAEPGEVLFVLETQHGTEYVPRGTTRVIETPSGPLVVVATARQFIPAKLADNPKLLENDPGYVQVLMGLDALRRKQLLEGDWLAKAAAGLLFKRHWCDLVDGSPREAYRLRFWDRASTVPRKGKDPDWTVGTRYATTGNGIYYVEHSHAMRGTPGDVERTIIQLAESDVLECGRRYSVALAQDPAQAGQADVDHYVQHPKLQRFDVQPIRESGDKVTRFLPFSAQAEQGNIKVVRGAWNARFFDELEGFPDGAHDDDADAASGAHNAIIELSPGRIARPDSHTDGRWEDQGRGY